MAAQRDSTDLKAKREKDHHALMKALKDKDYSGAELIVRRGGFIESLKDNSETPLIYAVKNRDKHFIQLLLNAGASTEARDSGGQTALSHAVFMRKNNAAEILIRKGASVNTTARNSTTPLMIAVMRDYISTIYLLLGAGADIEAKGPGGKTALLLAAEGRNMRVVKILIQRGACVTAVDDCGASALMTALESAVRFPNDDIAKILLDLLAHVDDTSRFDAYIKMIGNKYRLNPLEKASLSSARSCEIKPLVHYLLTCGVGVNAPGAEGENLNVTTDGYHLKTGKRVDFIHKLLRMQQALLDTKINFDAFKYLFGFDLKPTSEMAFVRGMTPLALAVNLGDIDTVKLFLDHGALIDVAATNGRTAFMTALKLRKTEIAKLLVAHDACVNTADVDGQTPLMYAITSGDVVMIKLLLDLDACVNSKDKNGVTPLLIAAGDEDRRGKINIVEPLIERGASVNTADKDGTTPLMAALKYRETDIALLLLRHGASVNGSDMYGKTPLMAALQDCRTDMVKLLLERGASVNATDTDGATPLMCVLTTHGDSLADKVSLLLQHGACVNTASVHGQTPLMDAAKLDSVKVVSLLLEHNAQVNTANDKGETPLMVATDCGNTKVMRMLLEWDACVDVKDNKGNTPAMIAARQKTTEKLELLLNHGACVNAADLKGETALTSAIKKDNLEMIKLLIERGASVDVIDNDGKTLLILAAETGQVKAMQHILEAGTSTINVSDSEGHTAMLRAIVKIKKYQLSSTVKMLIEYGGDVNVVANDGNTALILAAKGHDLACIDILMENGFCKLDSRDPLGYTALMYLLRENLKTYIFKLLQHGASVNTEGKDGESPLSLALKHTDSRKDVESIVTSLLDHGADMSLVRQAQKYLNRMICERKNDTVQKMIRNGCPPLCSPCSIYRDQPVEPRSALEVALLSRNIRAFKHILTKRFFTHSDVIHFSKSFEDVLNTFALFCKNLPERELCTAKVKSFIQSLPEPPLTLFTLSFVSVSSTLAATGKPSSISGGTEKPSIAGGLEHAQDVSSKSNFDNNNMPRQDHQLSSSSATCSESNSQSTVEAWDEIKCSPHSQAANPRRLLDDTNTSCTLKPTLAEEKISETWRLDKALSRKEKVHLLPLPTSLKKALLFQEPDGARPADNDGDNDDGDIVYREENYFEQLYCSCSDSDTDTDFDDYWGYSDYGDTYSDGYDYDYYGFSD